RRVPAGGDALGLAQRSHSLHDLVDTLPSRFLGACDDRAQGHAEAGAARIAGCGCANARDQLAGLSLGLTPVGVDIGVAARDVERFFGGAAEEDRKVRGLYCAVA